MYNTSIRLVCIISTTLQSKSISINRTQIKFKCTDTHSWFGLYAKAAILLRDTQSFVHQIITIRNPVPREVVFARFEQLGDRLCQLQDTYSTVPYNPAQAMSESHV